jgi:hypothetical protein
LARLVPMASMPVESLVELEGHELAYGTTVIMVTSVASAALIKHLQQLKRTGHKPVLLLITDQEQPFAALDGMPAYAIRIEDTR